MSSVFTLTPALSRVSNLPTVWTNCMVAWAINQSAEKIVGQTPAWHDPSFFEWSTLGWLLFGASFVYSGGCVLNDAFDYEHDQKYNPTRPIPSGAISCSTVGESDGAFFRWRIPNRNGFLFLAIGGLSNLCSLSV